MGCVRDLLIALVVALGLSVFAGAAHAQNYEAALAGFATNSYGDTDTAVGAVAASGNPLALQLIDALQAGRLLFSSDDKKIYIREASGALLDAATGRAITGSPPDNLKPVRVNNRVRRAIDAAVGGLTLLSSDPAKRLEAARAVFKSRDAGLIKNSRRCDRQGNRIARQTRAH